tara:strand:- start:3248 stop:3778 length:531 start_codon:yes stop_codon:yes gene_type:complete
MPFFSELLSIVIVTVAIGYIFSGLIKFPFIKKSKYDILKFSMLVSAPAVILHELAHKFIAIILGLKATFFASYTGLAIGVFLKLIHSPFIVLVPGFVSISPTTPLNSSMVAFAGPFTNLLLWITATLLLKQKNISNKTILFLAYTKRINLILFIFNMIPFGPLDGAKVFSGLFSLF